MAAKGLDSGGINQEEIDDMTTCCICTEIYTDPKALPCIHTFCMKCLEKNGLKTNKRPGDEMPCPICRRLFKIPPEGFNGLPKNFFIERLIQVSNVSDQPASSRAPCDTCAEENKEESGKNIPAANTYCFDCNQKFCEECSRHHRKFKLTKNHKLIDINEHNGGQNSMAYLAPSVCELHERKVLDVYCDDCKTVTCAICFIENHKNHEGSHVDKFVDDFRKQIERKAEAINKCQSIAQMKQAKLLEVKEDTKERVEKLEFDVANRKEELKQLIDKQEASLLQDLCFIKQSKLKEIQMAADDIDTYLSSLETYNSYCQKIMANGSTSDICRALSDLSARAVELQQQLQPVNEIEFQSFNFHFRKSELKEFLGENCDNLIGEIEDVRKKIVNLEGKLKQEHNEKEQLMQIEENLRSQVELRYKSDPVLVQTIRTHAAEEEKKGICGLTILDKELFVLNTKSSEVEVYDSVKFSFRRRWNLKELIHPRDIGSCNKNKCLYIIDSKVSGQSKEILRVDPNGKLIKNWSTGDVYGMGLSVTDESNVILTIYKKNILCEYSPSGQLIREINLSSDAGIRSPWHAIKLTNGNFVVSHGYLGDYLNRVCLVDADGNLKKSFGGTRGSTAGQMNLPVHMSIDEIGFVMVVERENRRVLLLDSNLEFKREILSKVKHGLRSPHRILLDESSGRLFVADNDLTYDGRILIFEF